MRIYLLWFVVIFLCMYAWRDWFKALCALVLMMAVFERPDMPKGVFGIAGMNPWNLLFVNVLLSWLVNKKKEVAVPKVDNTVVFLVTWYVIVIMIAFFREINDLQGMHEFRRITGRPALSPVGIIKEDTINTFKYAIPGLLLFLGCNSEKRFKLAIASVLLMNFLLALQIVKVMPIGLLTDGHALQEAAKRILDRNIGYFRSDLAVLLGGASWAIYTYRALLKNKFVSLSALAASLITVFSVALTGGRIGMGGWIVTGLTMSILRWKKLLIITPIIAMLVVALIPSVQDRFLQGFSDDPEDTYADSDVQSSDSDVNMASVTSGRTIIWPYVIDEIKQAPLLGHGRRAMQRIGLSAFLGYEYREPFPHPHNAYMQLLLDNGLILSLPIFFFFYIVLKRSFELFRDSRDNIFIVAGGVGISFTLSQLVGAVGGQTFYPTSGTVSMWCAIGIMLRVYYERQAFDSRINDNQQSSLWESSNEQPHTRSNNNFFR